MRKTAAFTSIMLLVGILQIAFAGDEANVGDVVVIEIMQNPNAVSDENGEWFEIYNTTTSTINIEGWTFKDAGSNSFTVYSTLNISGKSVLVLCRNDIDSLNGGVSCDYDYPNAFALGQTDDEIIIKDNSGDPIDSVYYDGGPNFPDPTGASMTLNVSNLTDLFIKNNLGSNWTTESTSTYGDGDYGTPGVIAGDQSLPVELTSFTADNSRAGEITLNWVTESEIENLGFILERGAESEDGTTAEWTEIASYITDEALRGQGSVTYRTEYTYTDKSVEPGVTYDYRLADVSYAGEKVYHALNVLGVEVSELPRQFALLPAYPNPFNPETVIRYQLSADSDVSLQIYDVKGQMIERLVNKPQKLGYYSLNWKPSNLPSGVYFCKLTIGDRASTQKLILLK